MANGWVYILTNPSYPDLVKVGLTTTSPEQRLKELSSPTGVASNFTLHSSFLVDDVNLAEKKAHDVLEQVFGRPNSRREFFSASPDDAYAVLQGALQAYITPDPLGSFQRSIELIRSKSFSLGCIEFESAIKLETSGSAQRLSKEIAGAYGIYIAACAQLARTPVYPHFMEALRYKDIILTTAIETAATFTDEPTDFILSFSRSVLA